MTKAPSTTFRRIFVHPSDLFLTKIGQDNSGLTDRTTKGCTASYRYEWTHLKTIRIIDRKRYRENRRDKRTEEIEDNRIDRRDTEKEKGRAFICNGNGLPKRLLG